MYNRPPVIISNYYHRVNFRQGLLYLNLETKFNFCLSFQKNVQPLSLPPMVPYQGSYESLSFKAMKREIIHSQHYTSLK